MQAPYRGKYRASIGSKLCNYNKDFEVEEHAARDRDLVILKLPGTMFKMNFVWTLEEIAHWSVLLKNKYYEQVN